MRIRSIPQVGFELGSTFVQGNSVAECIDNSIGGGEGKSLWQEAD